MASPTITVKIKEKRCTLADPRRNYDYAWVVLEGGKRIIEMGFSKFEHESEWKLDTMFKGHLPVMNHGEASRCCSKEKAADILLEAIEKADYTEVVED